jgi:hypothetical protein
MLKVNLILTEYLTGIKGSVDSEKLKAAKSIKDLLTQIDFSAESVPENNPDMFVRLLVSLKGKPLNEAENELVMEIMG